ncbi:GAF domain-containing protein [Trichothermofontia sp.]
MEWSVLAPVPPSLAPGPEAARLDDWVRLAAFIGQVPIAFISLRVDDQHWIKAMVGLAVTLTPYHLPWCEQTLVATESLIVPDLSHDRRFAQSPLVLYPPALRFYAGFPLRSPGTAAGESATGTAIGCLGVMDLSPRQLQAAQYHALLALVRQVAADLVRAASPPQHCPVVASSLLGKPLSASPELPVVLPTVSPPSALPSDTPVPSPPTAHRQLLERITEGYLALDAQWQLTDLNACAEQLFFKTRAELIGQPIWDSLPDLRDTPFAAESQRVFREQRAVQFEMFYPPLGVWLEMRVYPEAAGVVVLCRDITSVKQAEAALAERTALSALGAAVSLALAHGGSLVDSLQACLEAIVTHLPDAFAYLWTLNPESQLLEQQVVVGDHAPTDDFPPLIAPGISMIGFIAHTRQPYLTNTVLHDLCVAKADWVKAERVIAFAGYPLVVEDRLVGVMAVFRRQPLTDAAIAILDWVANDMAVAIDRAWAREELLSRREALLFRLARQIHNSLELDTILKTAVQEIRGLLQIKCCHFVWYWPQSQPPLLAITHEARDADLPTSLGDCPVGTRTGLIEKLQRLETLRLDDATQLPTATAESQLLLSDLAVTAQLMVPLETCAGQLGAIVCTHCDEPRPWTSSEVALLQAVRDQLALAIDQAELFAKSRASAFAAEAQAHQLSEALRNLKQTQAQLIQSEKMSSLGQMVAGIAHEINNPVSFISGNLNHAMNYTHDLLNLLECYQRNYPEAVPEVRELAEAIDLGFIAEDLPNLLNSMKVGTDRIRQIVLSLRNFSRLDEAALKPVDIHEGLENTLLILQSRLKPVGKRPGIRIEKHYGQLPQVECYAGPLNQVFMNILNNAIDALSEQPDPVITIQTEVQTLDGQAFAAICIRDNGPGLSPEVQQHLFDPFFTTKPVGQGTGLGLSISYQIVVERHGGSLICESELGHGAAFWVRIPLALTPVGV